ncbi:cytochrome P450 [Streptomyces armeniacus]|uniref:Cytochrome P450 n=1 Tax=Streptomyces armeniacus TaxID=83291 RepID=A0A345XLM7_9ACTN|nr:cytochrome P450 [Streptomyces armeniacus]AXK32543.1 cytochrome P450 [Streptomyces armeniacus]
MDRTSNSAEIPRFPFAGTDPLRPPAEFAELRAGQPVARAALPNGHTVWLVTRHEDVRRVFGDPRFSRAAVTAPDAPKILPVTTGSKSLFVLDPPEHTRLRKLVARAFTVRSVEQLRPHVAELADGMVARMRRAGPPADLVEGLARPLPITVICELLGVPDEDHGLFQEWTDLLLTFGQGSAERVRAAVGELRAYLSELIERKRRDPGEDLLSELVAARDSAELLSTEELLAFGQTMLVAGYHATTAEICHAVLNLAGPPVAELAADPARIPAAVEELLRFSQAGGGVGPIRIAVEDVVIGGVTVRAGEAVLPCVNSANHDERVFAAPGTLDLAREHNPHLAFGHGIHHCLGAHLGRVELQVVLEALVRELGAFALAEPEQDLHWSQGRAFRIPEKLRLTW